MNTHPATIRRFFAVVTFFCTGIYYFSPTAAQQCPEGSIEIGRRVEGDTLILDCKVAANNPGKEVTDEREKTMDQTAWSFISSFAAAVTREKNDIVSAPLTPGSATAGPLSGNIDYEEKVAAHEARKADVFARMIAQSELRDQCRQKLPSCSADGKAYDEREAIRRRDRQYFLWGEASYYIAWTDLLKEVPPEMKHEVGTWGAIKTWPYIGEDFYTWLKRDIIEYGSTPPGGEGQAKQGLRKAVNDNRELNP